MTYDVAVVGLGSSGSMALWQMSQVDGLSVVGIEQFGIGHTYGSFTGESRLFRTAVHEGARYVPMLRRSRELWRSLEREVGRDLYLEVGALNIGERDSAPIRSTLESAETFDVPHELLDADALRARFPQHGAIDDGTVGVLDAHGGGLRPEASVVGAVRAARDRGAHVVTNAPVERIDTSGPTVRILTAKGLIEARRVVVTGGSWSHILNPELTRLLTVTPILLTWFVPRHPAEYTGASFPAFIRDRGPVHFFGAPCLDGFSVKISGLPPWDDVATVEDLPTVLDREIVEQLGRDAEECFPGIEPEPVRMSIHHDGSTRDRTPIIDLSPDGRVVTIAGLSGHGFKFAPVLGEIARDLATEGGSDLVGADLSIAAHLRRNLR